MTTKPHPTDAMEMPELTQQQIDSVKEIIAGLAFICEINDTATLVDYVIKELSKHHVDQLRVERIKAYDLGEAAGYARALGEVEEKLALTYHSGTGPEGWLRCALDTVRSMKHEQQ